MSNYPCCLFNPEDKAVTEEEMMTNSDVARHMPILNGVRHSYKEALLYVGGHDAGVGQSVRGNL